MRTFFAAVLILTAVMQAAAHEPPCKHPGDYLALEKEYASAYSALVGLLGQTDAPEYEQVLKRHGEAFANKTNCKRLIGQMAAPSEVKRAMFGQAAAQ